MKPRVVFSLSVFAASVFYVAIADAAVVARKQSAIQTGTTVRSRTEATGVYDQECHDA